MPAEPPGVKAAPKRRRGGKHRHKGLAAEGMAEAGMSGKEDASSAQPDAVSDGTLSDKLAGLQLNRLASNAAAGTCVLPCIVRHALRTLRLQNLVCGTLGLTCTHDVAHMQTGGNSGNASQALHAQHDHHVCDK